MITFTMKQDKSFVKSGDERTYRGEKSAQQIKVILPTAVNGIPIAECQLRLCFALGQSGDFSVLENGTPQSEGIAYLYTVDSPLTQQAGIYRIWMEFWCYDGHLDAPSFCLKSETAEFFVLPHPHSQDLVTPAQLTAFAQLQKTVEEYLRRANESALTAESASEDAKAQASSIEGSVQQVAQNANQAKESANQVQANAQQVQQSVQQVQQSAQQANESAYQAQQSAHQATANAQLAQQSANQAQQSAVKATEAAAAALAEKRIFLRYAENALGDAMVETPTENTAYVGIAFAENAPTEPNAYAWFLQDSQTAVHQGDPEIALLGGGRIVCTKDGSIVLQPSDHDSNTGAHSYNFTTGVLNYNGGYAAVVCGYQNRANASQQLIAGQNNVAPASRNMAVVGQFCDSRLTNLEGNDSIRPLFAVGAGTSTSDRKNALTVYSNGEAVLQKEGEQLPLYDTLKVHSNLIRQALDTIGNGAYESAEVRIAKEPVKIPSEALSYAMITKIGAMSNFENGILQTENDLQLYRYNDEGNRISAERVPDRIAELPDFGHGVSLSLCNEVDLSNGTYTQSCGVYVFTGEESMIVSIGTSSNIFCKISTDYDGSAGEDIRARWNYGDVGIDDVSEKASDAPFAMALRYTSNPLQKGVFFYAPDYTTTTLKAYLKERYESGSPICIVYRKKTPVVTEIEDVPLWSVELGENRTFSFAPTIDTAQEVAWAQMQYQIKEGSV